ncbi:MAG TPA: DUF2939 domain-containing protein [Rhizomicrobium sp.]|nr:DUF2939 domain-containing protein [Rhizomicrobium sp.]
MRISRPLIATALILAFLLVVWYFAAPFLLLRSLSFAVKNGDRDTIAADVDFPAVRDGLKQQLGSYVQGHAPKKHNPFSNLLLQLAPSISNQVIDAVVTPDGVATILRQHVPQTASGSASRPSLWHGDFAWIGSDHLRATYANARHPDQPVSLDLERRGLFGWQVTGLTLPLKAFIGHN